MIWLANCFRRNPIRHEGKTDTWYFGLGSAVRSQDVSKFLPNIVSLKIKAKNYPSFKGLLAPKVCTDSESLSWFKGGLIISEKDVLWKTFGPKTFFVNFHCQFSFIDKFIKKISKILLKTSCMIVSVFSRTKTLSCFRYQNDKL